MDNLGQQTPLVVQLEAEAERPICHFELPPTSTACERENIRVIEFQSLGCRIKNTKRFYIVNATATGYEFEWRKVEEEVEPNEDHNTNNDNYFRCLT